MSVSTEDQAITLLQQQVQSLQQQINQILTRSVTPTNVYPASDLPLSSPGASDCMVGIDVANGVLRRFQLSQLPLTDVQKTALDAVVAGQTTGYAGYALRSDLPAAGVANRIALVGSDPDPENNGTWRDTGSEWVKADDRVTDLVAEMPLKADKYAEYIADVLSGFKRIGLLYPFSAPTKDAANGSTFIINDLTARAGVVAQLYVYVTGAGDGVFEFVQKQSDGTYNLVGSLQHTFAAAGYFVIPTNIDLPANSTISYRRVAGGAANIGYSDGDGVSFFTLTSNLQPSGNVMPDATSDNLCLAATVVYKVETSSIDASIATLDESDIIKGLALPYPASTLKGSNGATYILSDLLTERSFIDTLYFAINEEGSANTAIIDFLKKETDGTYSLVDTFTYATAAHGMNMVGASQGFAGIYLPAGGTIGYRQVNASTVLYSKGSGNSFVTYTEDGGVLSATGNILPSPTVDNLCLSYHATSAVLSESVIPADIARLSDIPDSRPVRNPRIELDSAAFEALPDGWVNAGGFTFGDSGATSTALGLANQLRSSKRWALEKRTISWKFQIAEAGSIVALLSNPIEGATSAGGLLTFDSTDNTIKRWVRYTGSNDPTTGSPLETIDLGFTPVVGKSYIVEIELSGRMATLRAYEKVGPGWTETERTAIPRGWTVYNTGTNLYDQGMWHGAPAVAALAGIVVVESYEQHAPYFAQPWIYAAGDSETEGFSLTDDQKWARLLANEFAPGDVVSSGVGGTKSAGLYLRMQQELEVITPKYVIVWIGTNLDSDIAANLAKIRTLVQGIGATLIVCTVPRYAAATDSVLALPDDVIKVRLEYALTEEGAGGGTPILQYFQTTDEAGNTYSDGYHLGPLGGPQLIRRLRIDVPELFN